MSGGGAAKAPGDGPRGRHGRPGSPRARLFVALDPPAAARAAVAGWRDHLITGRADLRPVAREALHVTLAFLGYLPERSIEAVASAMRAAAAGAAEVSLAPGAVRAVPARAPRLFALELDDERGDCGTLQAAVVQSLAAARLHRPERRPFWPHITLARVKRGRKAPPLVAEGEPPPPFRAGEVVLYRSHLSREGARYEALARAALSGRSDDEPR